jgi:hypothetical protein
MTMRERSCSVAPLRSRIAARAWANRRSGRHPQTDLYQAQTFLQRTNDRPEAGPLHRPRQAGRLCFPVHLRTRRAADGEQVRQIGEINVAVFADVAVLLGRPADGPAVREQARQVSEADRAEPHDVCVTVERPVDDRQILCRPDTGRGTA